jgi:hypothetical protein
MKNERFFGSIIYFGLAVFLAVVVTTSGVFAVEQTQPVPPPTVAPVAAQARTNPTPAPAPGQPPVAGEPASKSGPVTAPEASGTSPINPGAVTKDASAEPIRLYMPDGQLKSHLIRVYVNREILSDQKPELRLLRSHAITAKAADESIWRTPLVFASGQEWVEPLYGQQVRRSGTLLLFDIRDLAELGPKAMLRVTPILRWKEDGSYRFAIGPTEVNVGNIVAAASWTLLAVALAVLLVIVLACRTKGSPLSFLAGVDGHLSLAQTQVACWTVVVGGVVLGYGFIRLAIPDIPSSLLVLMGTSLTTGGVAYFKDEQKQGVAVASGLAPVRQALALKDLVIGFTPGQKPELSLAKAQMLFWTVLLLVLFIAKSILDGAIWDVPWPLVALMGFSQIGYLAPKLAPQP